MAYLNEKVDKESNIRCLLSIDWYRNAKVPIVYVGNEGIDNMFSKYCSKICMH
jgi:hypothetical protein